MGHRNTRTFARVVTSCILAGGVAAGGASAEAPRAYELVSPPDTQGVKVVPQVPFIQATPTSLSAASESGDRIVFGSGLQVLPGYPAATGAGNYVAERGASGWTTFYAGIPPRLEGGQNKGANPAGWATDLSRMVFYSGARLNADDAPPRDDGYDGLDLFAQDRDAYGTAAFDWVSRAPARSEASDSGDGVTPSALSADGKTALFSDNLPLVNGAPNYSIYVNRDPAQNAELVSVYPNNEPVAGPTDGKLSGNGVLATFQGPASSQDPTTHSFVRLLSEQETIDLGPGAVDQISRDGSVLTVVSEARLTADDTDSSRDIYSFDVSSRSFTRMSTGAPNTAPAGNTDACDSTIAEENSGAPPAGCGVAPVATTVDGSVVYFLSPERLTTGNGSRAPRQDAANLYASTGGSTRFVTTLSSSDLNRVTASGVTTEIGYLQGAGGQRPVRTSTDGSKLVFESNADPLNVTGVGTSQVYTYDVSSGSLTCASCAIAQGGTLRPAFLTSRVARRPQAETLNKEGVGGRGITGDGSEVFFETDSRLAGEDRNEATDVYEYSTTSGSTTLLSGGRGGASYYMASSEDGRDVFFQTKNTLVGADRNGQVNKIYDVRRGGGFPESPTPPGVCLGPECRGGLPAPPAAGSATSTGNPTDNAAPAMRLTIALAGPSRVGRLRAARSGRVTVRVRASRAARVRVSARTRIRGVLRVVGTRSAVVRSGRPVSITIALSRSARTLLRRGPLNVRISAAASGARDRMITTSLGGAR